MKTTSHIHYSCGHVVEETKEDNNGQEVVLNSADQVFGGDNYCHCDDPYCHCEENQQQEIIQNTKDSKTLLRKPNEDEFASYSKNNIEEKEEEIFRTQKTGPIRVLIPLPDNQIEKGDEMCYPAEREPVQEIEEIYEKPKVFEVVPENIDFMTLLAQIPKEKEEIREITPSEKLDLIANPNKQPYLNTQIVNNPSELFERLPSNWNETNEQNLASKMQIKRPFRVPWNQTNEQEKAVKMRIKAPKKLTWNETNQENEDDRFNIDALPKPEFERENFDFLVPDSGRRFKVIEPDDEEEVCLEGRKKIFEVENQEGGEVKGGYRPDWNRDCEPENNIRQEYRGIPKAAFEETKGEDLLLEGIPFSLDWNSKNQEEAPLSMLLPGKPKPLVIENEERYEEPGVPKNWNLSNQKQRAMHINYDKTRIPQDFDMIKEQDFHMPESDDIIVNDDYNTCDANIVRPVKAIISKINEGTESEDIQDIDVLEGVTRQELQRYGEVLQPMQNNYYGYQQQELRSVPGQKLKTTYKKSSKPVVQQYETSVRVPGKLKERGIEYLRDDKNYNFEI